MDFKETIFKKTFYVCFLAIIVFVASCVPQQGISDKRKNAAKISNGGDNGSEDDKPPANDPNFESEQFYWYVEGQTVENMAGINESTQSVLYLGGKSINSFLKIPGNDTLTYCLVASFFITNTNAKHTLRARAIPIVFNNFSTKTLERRFRIDIAEQTTNQATCTGSVLRINATGDETLNNQADAAFSPLQLCTECTGKLKSSDISLYTKNGNTLLPSDRITSNYLALSPVSLQIDTQNSSNVPTVTCTNNECTAQGFDCCLEGQCVTDGALKPNASSEPNYTQVIAEILEHPSHFINYPNIYFICGSGGLPPTPTATPTPDPTTVALEEFQKLKQEYLCLEKGPTGDYSDCKPNFNLQSFLDLREEVYTRCGCTLPPPIDPEDPRCPEFGLKAQFDHLQNITEVTCKIPPVVVDPTPFQNLSLYVSSRSVPHRFFDTNGNNIDELETVKHLSPLPQVEGDPFSYLSPLEHTGPIGNSFNMNAILGQMKVEINSVVPAKMVHVEFDQTYIIHTTFGYFTPCPQCANDAWFDNFKAHPPVPVSGGNGLRAVGYSTARDEIDGNTSFGNYEDTIFGRACFIPPTMIPLSHKPNTNLNAQRRNRLKSQATYFINGYQRDWYGFNKGAVIGSFDGVTWFAIGSGRRVTSTSNKLFIAINNPYADLADQSNYIVSIVSDLGNNVAADFDFDPELPIDTPHQNTGATCQQYHQCSVDSDCITKLGWEYMCADISFYKTSWPRFDINGKELTNQYIASASFNQILQGEFPEGSLKRCVYRGMGAPCAVNPLAAINASNNEIRKMVTCAPNFYCAKITNSVFNSQIVREPSSIDNFLFGREANVLGRSLNYMGANDSLPPEAIDNISYAMSPWVSNNDNIGMCRPGKQIANNDPMMQHQNHDSGGRTDYISQIGTCNSGAMNGDPRHWGCPVIETREDNPNIPKGDIIWNPGVTDFIQLRREQNMCGGESRNSSGISAFQAIEFGPLNSIFGIMTPGFAVDACLRKAGSLCHTNLDCGPNKLHAEQADFLGDNYFGGTEAEHNYWREHLICGQIKPKPWPTDSEYLEYDMTKNVCCRDIGLDFTMYTQSDSNIVVESIGTVNTSLKTAALPSYGSTTSAPGRYSRYSVVDVKSLYASATPGHQAPIVNKNETPRQYQWKTIHDTGEKTCCGGGWIRKFADGTHHWASYYQRSVLPVDSFQCLNYTNTLHLERPPEVLEKDYLKESDRLCWSPAEGGCVQIPDGINYPQNALGSNNIGLLLSGAINWKGFGVESTEIRPPLAPPGTGPNSNRVWFLDTSPIDGLETFLQAKSIYAPYQPTTTGNITNANEQSYNFILDPLTAASEFYLPIYIGQTNFGTSAEGNGNNIVDVYLKYFDTNDNLVHVEHVSMTTNDADLVPPINAEKPSRWKIKNVNGRRVFKIMAYQNTIRATKSDGTFWYDNQGDYVLFCLGTLPSYSCQPHGISADASVPASSLWSYAGVVIKFRPMGSQLYHKVGGNLGEANSGLMPGNALYYLTKLGRLDLLGIPQIFYEPIYCNTDRSQLMPGIFDDNITTRAQFDSNSFIHNHLTNGRPLHQIYNHQNANTYMNDPSNPNKKITLQDKVGLDKIFSEHEFTCCLKLGSKTPIAHDGSRCCSGFAAEIEDGGPKDGNTYCLLPSRTNVNVYLNKFVSSEGTGDHLMVEPLEDDDFIPETGEPKLTEAVDAKIAAFAATYCANQGAYRKGGLFGFYFAEPNDGTFRQFGSIEDSKFYSPADSMADWDNLNNSGAGAFISGYRWNHHYYCE